MIQNEIMQRHFEDEDRNLIFPPHIRQNTVLAHHISILKREHIVEKWHIQELWQRHIESLSNSVGDRNSPHAKLASF